VNENTARGVLDLAISCGEVIFASGASGCSKRCRFVGPLMGVQVRLGRKRDEKI
jgi:hypothetical protein